MDRDNGVPVRSECDAEIHFKQFSNIKRLFVGIATCNVALLFESPMDGKNHNNKLSSYSTLDGRMIHLCSTYHKISLFLRTLNSKCLTFAHIRPIYVIQPELI